MTQKIVWLFVELRVALSWECRCEFVYGQKMNAISISLNSLSFYFPGLEMKYDYLDSSLRSQLHSTASYKHQMTANRVFEKSVLKSLNENMTNVCIQIVQIRTTSKNMIMWIRSNVWWKQWNFLERDLILFKWRENKRNFYCQ